MAKIEVRRAFNTFEIRRASFRKGLHAIVKGSNATQVVSGSGVTENYEDSISLQLGTTHASTAGRYFAVYLPGTADPNGINWGKKLYLGFTLVFRGTVFTNITLRAHFTQATTIGNLTAHGLGMQSNAANINLATYGTGGSQQLVSAATNLVTADRVHIHIEHDPASQDRLYINDTLTSAVQSTAADIPSTEPAATYYLFFSISRSGGVDTGNEYVIIENIALGMEF